MARKMTLTLGWIFLIIGILGFIPGVTSNGQLLGIFEVNATHNIVHLITGILALLFAKTEEKARGYAKTFGIIYALVTIIGFFPGGSVLGLFRVDMADNVLHLVVAVLWLWAGFGGKRTAPAPAMSGGGGDQQSMG